jgi:aryl-alcohol dehydrogenase-like predicted oxidoreductase
MQTPTRYLGNSGLQVPRLCLGTMMFGGETDEPTSHRILAKAREQGFFFLDTADVYNKGRSEEVIGRFVKEDRDRWVIASKLVNPMGDGPNERGGSRKWVIQAVEASLRRMGTDHLDIMYLHRAVFDAPMAETIRALGDLIRQGKLRYFGVSNFRGWRIAEAARLCDEFGMDRPIVSQPLYNLATRMAEVEQLPAAAHYGLGVVPYSPLARGVLSGKYAPDAPPPPGSRAARNDKRIHETEWRPESLKLARAVTAHCEARGISPVAFAIGWVLNNKMVTAPIAGPRTEEQWDSYVAALDTPFTAEDEAFANSMVPPGHTSTPGWTDPAHPVEGRVPWVG